MTDAPNSVSEFGWRKPHPRRTPPWASLLPFFCRGAGSVPPRRGNVRFPCQFPLSPERFPHRVGADLCVRPDTPLRGTRSRADTQVGPYRFYRKPPVAPEVGRGQSPAPTEGKGDECPMPVRDLPSHRHPRLPQGRELRMIAGTPLRASVPCPNVPRNRVQRSAHAPSPKNPPYPLGWFPKEGPQPFLWSFQGGSGREIEIPPRIFLGDCQAGLRPLAARPARRGRGA